MSLKVCLVRSSLALIMTSLPGAGAGEGVDAVGPRGNESAPFQPSMFG